jgi:hypothetical protein
MTMKAFVIVMHNDEASLMLNGRTRIVALATHFRPLLSVMSSEILS